MMDDYLWYGMDEKRENAILEGGYTAKAWEGKIDFTEGRELEIWRSQ